MCRSEINLDENFCCWNWVKNVNRFDDFWVVVLRKGNSMRQRHEPWVLKCFRDRRQYIEFQICKFCDSSNDYRQLTLATSAVTCLSSFLNLLSSLRVRVENIVNFYWKSSPGYKKILFIADTSADKNIIQRSWSFTKTDSSPFLYIYIFVLSLINKKLFNF